MALVLLSVLAVGALTLDTLWALTSGQDRIVLVYKGRQGEVAVLRPMIAPDIGVQLDSGPRTIVENEVLRCREEARSHEATVEGAIGGEKSRVTELLLVCGERVFVVKSILFDPK